ncbi:MAG: hypothetical protein U0794_16375 [Isosphaeraceae bacterium]
MEGRRYRAPSTDGALLAEPSLDEAASTIAQNAERLAHWDHDFQGCSASRLRAMARTQVIVASRRFLDEYEVASPAIADVGSISRLVVTGHQAELFHPGVWVKNFALASLTREPGTVALNLIVDNDILKSPGIRVPYEESGTLRAERVEFDEWRGEVPYEDLRVADESIFRSFGDRVRDRLPASIPDPVIDVFWPYALELARSTDRLGLRFALARHQVEASWGVTNLEVPLSRVCETEAFQWFVSHVLAQLPRFQSVHNEALQRYRSLYGIRSRHHPVPDLTRQGDWLEAPFWVWRPSHPRRRPLLTRQLARSMELRIDGDDEPFIEIPLGPDRDACCAVEQLQTLSTRGIRLRTRALTTTMFARLLLGDLFLHGIGGAKYDELGDAIMQGFLGIDPPEYMTLSMTLWLGLGGDPQARSQLAEINRSVRDVEYKPELWLKKQAAPEALELVKAKVQAIAAPALTHPERLARFRTIRNLNEQLRTFVPNHKEQILLERDRLRESVHRDSLARSREYSLVLHSQAKLRRSFEQGLG